MRPILPPGGWGNPAGRGTSHTGDITRRLRAWSSRCARKANPYHPNDPAAFLNCPEGFLTHGIAHPWWGEAVDCRNYHEQRIIGGFSQYFVALYTGRARGGGGPLRTGGRTVRPALPVTLLYADRTSQVVVVPVRGRAVELKIPLAGAVRDVLADESGTAFVDIVTGYHAGRDGTP